METFLTIYLALCGIIAFVYFLCAMMEDSFMDTTRDILIPDTYMVGHFILGILLLPSVIIVALIYGLVILCKIPAFSRRPSNRRRR